MSVPSLSPRLSELFAALCDDTIADTAFDHLQQRLSSDSEALRLYVQYVDLHTCLPRLMSRMGLEDLDLALFSTVVSSESKKKPPAPLSSHPRLANSSLKSACAAALLFYGVFVLLAWDLRPNPDTYANHGFVTRSEQDEQAISLKVHDSRVVATLSAMSDAVWQLSAHEPLKQVGDTIQAESVLHLSAGRVQLTFVSGAKVTLEGPTRFVAQQSGQGYLVRGKLVAWVPKQAIGFTVETPTARIVDLGTEFGVEVGADQEAVVHMFSGEASVTPTGTTNRDSVKSTRLAAGEAVRVTVAQTIKPTTVAADRFVRSIESKQTSRGKKDHDVSYSQLILSARPLLYFSMDQVEQDRLIDSAAVKHHAKLRCSTSSTNPFSPGVTGTSLKLGGPESRDHAMVTNYQGTPTGRISVVAWVLAESRPHAATIAKNWGSKAMPGDQGQFHFGLRDDFGDLDLHVMDASRQRIHLFEGERFPLPQHRWQHVGFVANGEYLRLFRNGAEVGTIPCGPLLAKPDISCLGIGVKPFGTGDKPDHGIPGYWHGCIDELAIFDYPLSADFIQQLSQLKSE